MFTYITLFGFLGFAVYSSTWIYSIVKKDGRAKKNGKGTLISFLVMIIGLVGLQFT
ncbi:MULTISPECIES: hypothetical protein [Priestia]|uniref:hypothetical protein n=1 Tax=Priestia TaxID=2800373 RepID=UPI002877AC2C|nr:MULTISPECIES: hypothetical protein [Priestia]MBX4162042.1 hypothetical protein [Priestia megaterium]MED3894684.1 hypothetical protein [Priestia aryabhattai]